MEVAAVVANYPPPLSTGLDKVLIDWKINERFSGLSVRPAPLLLLGGEFAVLCGFPLAFVAIAHFYIVK